MTSIASGNLPNVISKLIYSPSTEESILVDPNNQTPFGKMPPLKLTQSTTFQTSDLDVIVSETERNGDSANANNGDSHHLQANTNGHTKNIASQLTAISVGSPDCYESLDEMDDNEEREMLTARQKQMEMDEMGPKVTPNASPSNTERMSVSNLTLNDSSSGSSSSAGGALGLLSGALLSDNDSIPMCQLLMQLTGVQEDVLFAQYGYSKIKKLYNILQGELIDAVITNDHPLWQEKQLTLKLLNRSYGSNSNHANDACSPSAISSTDCSGTETKENQSDDIKSNDGVIDYPLHVTIKKCDKVLVAEQISYADDDDMHFCLDESILKEKLILQYVTIDNIPTCDYIAKYMDFFESEEDYYLVTESIDHGINLKDFVVKAHQFIKDGKLKCKEYQKIVKYIFWQLCAVIHWLHDDMHCCHLNLSMEAIILQNAKFIENNDGSMCIDPSIMVKLSDFSKAEVFRPTDNTFRCMKHSLISTNNAQYLSPKLYNEEIYDARAQDMWSLGMILLNCAIGEPLYDSIGIFEVAQPKRGTGYWAVMTNQLKIYLATNNLTKFVSTKMLSMVQSLLTIEEPKRINAYSVLKHQWFKSYYKNYGKRIEKKSIKQAEELAKQRNKMASFPYYYCKY